jgi:hypothetical protein
VLAAAAAWGWLRSPAVDHKLLQLDATFTRIAENDPPALSPDGTHLVHTQVDGTSLLIRNLADTAAVVLGGADDYWTPFFSPDGKSVGYLTGFPGALKVLTLDGGQVRTVVGAKAYGNGGAWADDGWIYYNGGERYGSQLMRVRAEGGAPEVIVVPDSAGTSRRSSTRTHCQVGVNTADRAPRHGDAGVALLDAHEPSRHCPGRGCVHALPNLVIMQADGSIAAKFDPSSGRSFRRLYWRKARPGGGCAH